MEAGGPTLFKVVLPPRNFDLVALNAVLPPPLENSNDKSNSKSNAISDSNLHSLIFEGS